MLPSLENLSERIERGWARGGRYVDKRTNLSERIESHGCWAVHSSRPSLLNLCERIEREAVQHVVRLEAGRLENLCERIESYGYSYQRHYVLDHANLCERIERRSFRRAPV